MRFDKRVTLIGESSEKFDPTTGNMVVVPGEETTIPCNASDLGVNRTTELFGKMDKQVTVVRLQRPYQRFVKGARLNGVDYNVIKIVGSRSKTSLYIEGV